MDAYEPIAIRVSNQRAFVFDVDHIARLRANHHITGVLGGTLPHLSQQNVFLGPPVILLPEEVVLLVTKGFAVLVDDPRAYRVPSVQELEEWDEQRITDAFQQLMRVRNQEDSKKSYAQSPEAIRKRREREERRGRENITREIAVVADDSSVLSTPAPTTSTSTPASVLSSNVPFSVSIPALSDGLPWYDPEPHTYVTMDEALKAGIWAYPSTEHERAKCKVFRDLWEKGYFMGGGSKFGGDWLVYPGDPLRYHSHFVATVQSSPDAPLRPMEIVAHGRLGTATKKAHLLCSWDSTTGQVSYLSIEWAGFG